MFLPRCENNYYICLAPTVYKWWKSGTTYTVIARVDIFGANEISFGYRQRNAVFTFSGCLSS